MFRLLLICSLALVATGSSIASKAREFDIDKRIVGGSAGSIDQFPFLVLISKKDTSARICGGTIVGDKWVLTSAKCVKDQTPENLSIKAGIADIATETNTIQLRDPAQIIIHPNYDSNNPFDNNIALIKVNEKFNINQYVQDVRIAEPGVELQGKAYTGGWGSEDPTTEVYKSDMKIAIVDIDSAADCQKGLDDLCAQKSELEACKQLKDFKFHERLLCTIHTNKDYERGICTGDFGGPLVRVTGQYDFLEGVNSMVIGDCGRGISLYTNVAEYAEFINEFRLKREASEAQE